MEVTFVHIYINGYLKLFPESRSKYLFLSLDLDLIDLNDYLSLDQTFFGV